jgi:hypothetical protein
MKIEYYHASKYGNGTMVAEEFKKHMSEKGIIVNSHHVKKVSPKEIPPADLYVFSSPGRFGKPIGDMQKFIKKANLVPQTKYAVVVTELCPNPETTKRMPTEKELGNCQRVLPIMKQALDNKGLIKITEEKIFVTGIKGPLENGWQNIVENFVTRILMLLNVNADEQLAVSQVNSVV